MMNHFPLYGELNDKSNNVLTEYDLTRKIGEGVYGKVYETKYGDVVKYFKDPYQQSTIREIAILSSLQHPNIVKVKKYQTMKKSLIMVMEKAKGDLHQVCQNITKQQRPYIIWQLLNAVNYIHSFNVSHRDIKPSNILIFNEFDIKLCDFGLAKPGFLSGATHTKEVVSIWYRSPEIILDEGNYDCSVDIWSIGTILLEIIFKDKFPLMADTEIGLLLKIFNLLGTPTEKTYDGVSKTKHWKKIFPNFRGNIDKILLKTNVTEDEVDLLKKMLSWKPTRITASEALSHPYFHEILPFVTERYCINESKLIEDVTNYNIQDSIQQCQNFYYYKTILFSWLWDIKTELKMLNTTLLTSYRLFTKYAHENNIKKDNIQLIGIACFMVATYLLEEGCMDPEYSSCMTDYAYKSKEIFRAFTKILHHFQFKVINYIVEDNALFNLTCCIIALEPSLEWNYEKNKKIASMIINGDRTEQIDKVVQNIRNMPNENLKQVTLRCLI